METLIHRIFDRFKKEFKEEPVLFKSPGRVNLIGEHTDYNEGFVLPAATDKAIILALAARGDDACHLVSSDLGQDFICDIRSFAPSSLSWPNYLLGVIDQFLKSGLKLRGFNCVFGGNVPIGAGMSSSAAIEAGLAFALNTVFDLRLSSLSLVKLAQKAENEFVGVRCGIMDQFINIHGREKKVLKLDCRSLEYEYFPFERENLRIVVCDTLVRRELASSEYNVRRGQCEEGVRMLSRYAPGIKSLRDVTSDLLRSHRGELDPVIYRRCDYVLRENERVGLACSDLKAGDIASFGRRMYESHAGLRDDYQVSCAELDALVEAASQVRGVYGSRMMGAGFGGCTISLVEESRIQEFGEQVSRSYERAFQKTPRIHVIRVESGTQIINR